VTLLEAYRRTGADLPYADPARPRRIGMDGSYWRFTHAPSGRVVIVLRGHCHAAAGDWTLAAIAVHPGNRVFWSMQDTVVDDARRLRVAIDGAQLDVSWSEDLPWPRRAFGGLGPAQVIPGLHQYWHPHLLRGTARGSLTVDGATASLDGATVYAEGNWGTTFAGHWWWGQAHDVGDAACVTFAGGRMFGGAPTSVVVALGDEVMRFTPPFARMAVATADGRWRIRAQGLRHAIELEGEADPAGAHILPVPIPAERRVELRSAQHLAGHLRLTVRRGRRIVMRGETTLAGLERGVP
jgi:hypothetical protein